MRRIAIVFIAAVFLPSLVLGLLALRSAGEQRTILERQSAELYQNDTDALAAQLGDAILGRQREFANRVRGLLSGTSPRLLAADFAGEFGGQGVAFAVAPEGGVVAPSTPAAQNFLQENAGFLNSQTPSEVFPTRQSSYASEVSGKLSRLEKKAEGYADDAAPMASAPPSVPASDRTAAPALDALREAKGQESETRRVQPRQSPPGNDEALPSKIAPQISDFRTATAGSNDGVLARFDQNELELIFWTRPPEGEGYTFGLSMSATQVADYVREVFPALVGVLPDACVAVLDENAGPVSQSVSGFSADWKRPFVAAEIGELLPHWEVGLYLLRPDQIERSARLFTLTLVALIALALAAILGGGTFVALDARRQLQLARQKTDFVSNVSHELKTPLTSIRMFAELLETGRVAEPEKRSKYLRIISLESERLTRLINNVLDFARIEKGRRTGRKAPLDLHPEIARVWEAQNIHLREMGFASEWIADDPPYPVSADADAIGQLLVNLLSNAQKYSNERKEVTLHSWKEGGQLHISVLDRGVGLAPGEERKIFEPFYRSDDSLASGVQGTGLGLTLALGIALDHGGTLSGRSREGGGSAFTLTLPLTGREAT